MKELLFDCIEKIDAGETTFEIGEHFFFVRQFGPAKCLYGWKMTSTTVLEDTSCNTLLSAVIAQDDMVYIPVQNVFDIGEDEDLPEGYLHIRKALKIYSDIAQKKILKITRDTYGCSAVSQPPNASRVRSMAAEYLLYDLVPEKNLPRFYLGEATMFQILTGTLQMPKVIEQFIAENDSEYRFLYPVIDEAYKFAESLRKEPMMELHRKLEKEQFRTMTITLEKNGVTASGKANKSQFLLWLRNRIKAEDVELTGAIFSSTAEGRDVLHSLGGRYFSSGLDFGNILELKFRNNVLYHREETQEAKIA